MGNALSSAYSGDQEIDPTLENTKIGAKYEVQTDGISSEAVLDETATCTDHIEQLREFEADLKTKREQRRGILRDKKMEFDRLRSEVERLNQLKQKVESIEASLQEKEMNILSQDLRMEYERQLENMRSLRTLYQERSRIEKLEREQMQSQLEEIKKQMEQEQNKNKELQERMEKVEADNSEKYDEIKHLESSLGLAKAEGRQYQAELTVINQLFSEILLGFNNSQDIDLDKLQRQLEDHHDLLQDIVVNEVSSEVSYALPKLLLDLLNNADTSKGCDTELENIETEDLKGESSDCQQPAINSKMNSPEEIVQNLPKVWRVLIELLSHQMAPTNSLSGEDDSENPCYKTVQTAKGPSLVASVSQTFIRLKDLILEKKALEKETNHLKQLNGHLENRLQDQAKRLEHVQSELSKTWHVVGKLQKQHHLLHTQEKILRYELAQKRKLLTDLKEELEYSREKSAQAREKNTNTEQQWRLLRNEFASRKKNAIILKDDINNSVESGYSDDRECSSEDEPGYETDVSECAQKNQEDVGKVCDVLEIIQNEIAGIAHVGEDSGSKDITDENVGDVSETVEDGETTENGSDSKGATSTTDNCDLNVQNRSESQTSERETNAHEDKTVLIQIPTRTTTNIRLNTNESVDVTENISSGHTSGDEAKNDASEVASTSSSSETFEERLARREERLKRLEGQASNLVNQAASTATKSVDISNKLDSLHKTYGSKSKEASDDDDEVDGDDQK
ncbi:unnamed protein product [Acanthoscelides obtectus]|uniref:Uncharacterized protein n=1 Tax=Acanthoscelides obtectus TaxID=200917 RepID=A0A9P0KEE6_ACAOB|nr:unnamed protein product [Acanthoscelides obtectus]CAK1644721.1 hypothetical protein AOBTE_LOCUS13929 [Acanthoscelides obtectus]